MTTAWECADCDAQAATDDPDRDSLVQRSRAIHEALTDHTTTTVAEVPA